MTLPYTSSHGHHYIDTIPYTLPNEYHHVDTPPCDLDGIHGEVDIYDNKAYLSKAGPRDKLMNFTLPGFHLINLILITF